jgi:plastocyanin
MKKNIFSFLLLSLSITSFSTKWTITNSGDTFVPVTLTIQLGDSVQFSVGSNHQPVEVSQATWNTDGNTPLPGGFNLPFGGGLILPAQLETGTHYYVCSVHASMGMKGTIIVQSSTGINNQSLRNFIAFPNPADRGLTITCGKDKVGLQWMIEDQAGRNALTGKLESESTQIDIAELTPGIYLFEVAGQERSSIKFVKK